MRALLRIRLAVGFFGVAAVSAALPLVTLELTGESWAAWVSAVCAVVGLGGAGGMFLGWPLSREIRNLSEFASRVSRGDLSQHARIESRATAEEVVALEQSINYMLENLIELVSHIQRTAGVVAERANQLLETAEGVNVSTEEVTTSIEQIGSGAELQAELVEKTSALISDIATGIENTARSAEDAAVASGETAAAAQSGSQVGKLAVDKLRMVFEKIEDTGARVVRFGEKSKEIGNIVEVITKLSQQTNLLALNAAIEAARAGDYGRGFAVVADEIRKLAENSSNSADQIAALIHENLAESDSAVVSMRESTQELAEGREDMNTIIQSLENITGTAQKGADVVSQISRITREQLEGAQEMVKAIENISEVAVSNASTTEQVSGAIEKQSASMQAMASSAVELTNLSQDIKGKVTHFRLGAPGRGLPGRGT